MDNDLTWFAHVFVSLKDVAVQQAGASQHLGVESDVACVVDRCLRGGLVDSFQAESVLVLNGAEVLSAHQGTRAVSMVACTAATSASSSGSACACLPTAARESASATAFVDLF